MRLIRNEKEIIELLGSDKTDQQNRLIKQQSEFPNENCRIFCQVVRKLDCK